MAGITVTTVANVKYPYRHTISTRGHNVKSDVPIKNKGSDKGMTPHELALGALATCTSMKIIHHARMNQFDLTGVEIAVSESQSVSTVAGSPKKKSNIQLAITLTGKLTDEQVDALKALGDCPVHELFMMEKTITRNYEFVSTAK